MGSSMRGVGSGAGCFWLSSAGLHAFDAPKPDHAAPLPCRVSRSYEQPGDSRRRDDIQLGVHENRGLFPAGGRRDGDEADRPSVPELPFACC